MISDRREKVDRSLVGMADDYDLERGGIRLATRGWISVAARGFVIFQTSFLSKPNKLSFTGSKYSSIFHSHVRTLTTFSFLDTRKIFRNGSKHDCSYICLYFVFLIGHMCVYDQDPRNTYVYVYVFCDPYIIRERSKLNSERHINTTAKSGGIPAIRVLFRE